MIPSMASHLGTLERHTCEEIKYTEEAEPPHVSFWLPVTSLCFISPSSGMRTVTTEEKYLSAIGSGSVILERLTPLVQLEVLLET